MQKWMNGCRLQIADCRLQIGKKGWKEELIDELIRIRKGMNKWIHENE